MIFSVTERADFKRCRRRWYESSFNGNALTKPLPATALHVGSVWHRSHELVALADTPTPLDESVDTAFAESKAHIDADLITVRGHGLLSGEALDMVDERDLLEAMAINYQAYWSQRGEYPLPVGMKLIQAEQTVVVPVPGTPHSLEATLDGLMIHEPTGLIYVLERKTFERHPSPDDMLIEDQFTAYDWVIRELGYEPGGVAYDGSWKRKSPPRGRTMDDLFLRVPINHSQAALDDFQDALAQEVQDMAEACYNPAKRYPNKSTFTAGCSWCPVKAICDAMTERDDVESARAMMVPRDPGHRKDVWPKLTLGAAA